MKKGRLATKLSVLCNNNNLEIIERVIFENSSTLGIRRYPVERSVLDRKTRILNYKGNNIRVKIGYYRGRAVNRKFEYEDIRAVMKNNNIGYNLLLMELNKIIDDE